MMTKSPIRFRSLATVLLELEVWQSYFRVRSLVKTDMDQKNGEGEGGSLALSTPSYIRHRVTGKPTRLCRYLGKDSNLSLPEHTRKHVGLRGMEGPVTAIPRIWSQTAPLGPNKDTP